MNEQNAPRTPRIQPYDRMRAPIEALPFALRYQVVQAVRRTRIRHGLEESDGESAYQDALKDFRQGELSALYDNVNDFFERFTSGGLEGKEIETGCAVIEKALTLGSDALQFPSIDKFNREFLNDNGLDALLFALLVDAARLNLKKIDEHRGGWRLQAAYRRRRTQAAKREGKRIQELLKQWASFDEPAMMAAAERYVVYRHVYRGNFNRYRVHAELEGSFSDRHLREWFHDFDNALGYPAPKRGRPSKRTYPTTPPKDRPLQRKVNRSKGYRRP